MAVKANILIDQGTTFSTTIFVADENDVSIDITDNDFFASARKHYTSNTSYDFTCAVLNGPDGELQISMANTNTSSWPAGRYVYDVKMVDTSNVVTRIVEGLVTVKPSVTR
jgi:hypothetical protein